MFQVTEPNGSPPNNQSKAYKLLRDEIYLLGLDDHN